MYIPLHFRLDDLPDLHAAMRAARLPNLVTLSAEGRLMATPLPLMLVPDEGPQGTLYGHLARANPQWRDSQAGEAMVLFGGPEAYVSPSWYPSKQAHGKVVPTWNYVAVHAYGVPEFFDDADRLRALVGQLTDRHEAERAHPWAVDDAPAEFIAAQLRAIIGLRLPISRLEGKRKASQNRAAEDRAGVAEGLAVSPRPGDRDMASLIAR
jgi:transcriptional regulator